MSSNVKCLFSKDGKTWQDGSTLNWTKDDSITKIVIGSSPLASSDDPKETLLHVPTLPVDFNSVYPELTHLYLWKCDIKTLPKLPDKLKCLDLRGCANVKSFGELPHSLETLNLEGCAKLANLSRPVSTLRRIYLSGCSGFKSYALGSFLSHIDELSIPLLEFEASQCADITDISVLPKTLVRLILSGCANLKIVKGLDEFTRLRHLNLCGCTGLTRINDFPDNIQFAAIHGCENLEYFVNQTIGLYERGSEREPNVAEILHSRLKFGEKVVTSAHAKLLLVGDGRAGKSTLAKRLQWDELTDEQRKSKDFVNRKPTKEETFTHKVNFSRWKTKLIFSAKDASEINAIATERKLPPPCDSNHQIDGTIRIWDFGGQEIYHQTHRIFASAGSVFLIVWNPRPMSEQELKNEKRKQVIGISEEEWLEWNRRRSLDYWLDYVDSIRPDASVAIVCTHTPTNTGTDDWKNELRKHAKRELLCFKIDSLDDACNENSDYQKLLRFIRESCGHEAKKIGPMQPSFYSDVCDYVDGLLEENDAARHDPNCSPSNLLQTYPKWTESIRSLHASSSSTSIALTDKDIRVITGLLHQSGQVFQIRDPKNSAIVIDQTWATELIYQILRPPVNASDYCLFTWIRNHGGFFEKSHLDQAWASVSEETYREQLLSFMVQCGIIICIQDKAESRTATPLFLATEKWLLPKYDGQFADRCETLFTRIASLNDSCEVKQFTFDHDPISEFDFRSLIGYLGSILKTRAVFFQNGLQAVNNESDPAWCFQVRWKPEKTDSYFGTIDARLATSTSLRDDLQRQVEEVFSDARSPIIPKSAIRHETLEKSPLLYAYFRELRESDFDVGVSYSGRDSDVVKELIKSIKKSDLRIYEYSSPECRYEEYRKVKSFMEGLRNPACLLLFLSDNYLLAHENNFYCLWEFADAVNRLGAERPSKKLIVTYRKNDTLSSSTIRTIATQSLDFIGAHFDKKYQNLSRTDWATALEYRNYADHFHTAKSNLNRFFSEYSNEGAYSHYGVNADGSFDIAEIVKAIREALKG
jgi:GTPase SAR1 family protein